MTVRRTVCAALVAAAILVVGTSSSSAGTVTDTFTGHVDVAGVAAQVYSISVGDLSVPIQASLDWVDPAANLNLYLMAPGAPTPVAQATGTAKPKSLSYTPLVTGTYKLRVKAAVGASDFTLTVTYGNAAGGSGLAEYSKSYGFDAFAR